VEAPMSNAKMKKHKDKPTTKDIWVQLSMHECTFLLRRLNDVDMQGATKQGLKIARKIEENMKLVGVMFRYTPPDGLYGHEQR
jgi:hypothetical protein